MFEMDENRILIDPLEIDSIPFHNNHFQCSDEENLNVSSFDFLFNNFVHKQRESC